MPPGSTSRNPGDVPRRHEGAGAGCPRSAPAGLAAHGGGQLGGLRRDGAAEPANLRRSREEDVLRAKLPFVDDAGSARSGWPSKPVARPEAFRGKSIRQQRIQIAAGGDLTTATNVIRLNDRVGLDLRGMRLRRDQSPGGGSAAPAAPTSTAHGDDGCRCERTW
jgi:hypothetical protein